MTTQGKKLNRKTFLFNGEWIPEEDPLKIGESNFSELKNRRYTNTGTEGVLGYSKINTTALTTYLKGRNGIQLESPYDSQSRVLIQALNAAGTASRVLENKAAVPAQGDFEATAVHTDATGAGLGRFSKWPGGHIAYANGKEVMVYAGGELRCPGFINYAPDGDFKYNYGIAGSGAILNTETDATNVATLHRVTESTDANTLLLLHLDNNVTDSSPTTIHTVTFNGTAAYDATVKVFGTHSADFNGTDAYFSIPDNADFDFSGGTFTVDFRLYVDALPGAGTDYALYYQQTDAANYFKFSLDENGALTLSIFDTAAEVLGTAGMATPDGTISTATWYHVELVESGNNWWIFVDGVQQAYISDASRAADYTGSVYIGYDAASGAGFYLNGRLDEYRVSNVARHTGAFEISVAAYGSATYRTYIYVGSTRPVKGIKPYVATANTTAGALTVEYFDGSSWAAVAALFDGTASGGIPLAQTGTLSFTSTAATAKVKAIDGIVLYWYRIVVTECDATATISHVSVDAPFQSVKDLWNGFYRTAISFQVYTSSTYNDYTLNVAEQDYSSANTATYAALNSLAAATDYFVAGFQERQMGVNVTLVGGAVNTTANTILTIYYWAGDDWVSVGVIDDQSIQDNKSFAASGTITWNPPDHNTEFPTQISSDTTLYYYKFVFSQNLSLDVKLDAIKGISAPRQIPSGWKFPFEYKNYPMLCGYLTGKEGNRVDYGAKNTVDVHNGDDSSAGIAGSLYFGGSDDLTAAVGLYNRFGSSIYNTGIFLKKSDVFLLNGDSPYDWRIFQLSDKDGCPAPLTVATAAVGFGLAEDVSRNIAIWLAYSGPIVCDAALLVPVEGKIKNFFDQSRTDAIDLGYIEEAEGWVDPDNKEYNLIFQIKTGALKWIALDLVKRKWFEKEPDSGLTEPYPRAAFKVVDTNGRQYVYGLRDNGHMMRLENGATWDGEDITQTIKTADIIPGGDIGDLSSIKRVKLFSEVIAENPDVTITHYKDGSTTGTTLDTVEISGDNRHMRKTKTIDRHGWSHQFKFSCATSTTKKGVPLMGWGFEWEVLRTE